MIANYGICSQCCDLIENKAGAWRDIDGHSFSLVPLTGTGQFVFHNHKPMQEEDYNGAGKYNSLDSEILHCLGMLEFQSEEMGESDTFGFYQFFPDYCAILLEDSQGFVYVTIYDSVESAERNWKELEKEYSQFCDDMEEEKEYYYGADPENEDYDLCPVCSGPFDHSEAACQGDYESNWAEDAESDLYDIYED